MLEQRLATVRTNRSTSRLEIPAADTAAKARRVLASGSKDSKRPIE
jgi:hypothetical protein